MTNDNATKRDFSRNNFGERQNLLTLAALLLFIASVLVGVYNNIVVHSRLQDLASSQIDLPKAYIDKVAAMERQSGSYQLPLGDFVYKLQYGDSPIIFGRVIVLENNQISRWMFIDGEREFNAIADYEIVGSVVKYSNVKGDQYLFSKTGSPLYKYGDDVMIELDGSLRLTLYKELPSPPPSGDVIEIPDNRTLVEKLAGLSFLEILNKFLIISGVGVLLYILIMIMRTPSKPRNKRNSGKLAA